MTAAELILQFRDVIQSTGLTPPAEIVPNGKIHRFPPNGRPSDLAGWYVLHFDGIPAGAFGDFRQAISYTWHARIDRRLTKGERAAHRMRVEEISRQREAEVTKRQEEARQAAKGIWNPANAAPENHPYLKRKGVKSYGLRLYEGRLIVPMKIGDELHSLQFIESSGRKLFLVGGRKKGCYFEIGTEQAKKTDFVAIAEGYATGASIHEATGYTVVVAFDAGNLLPVAQALHERFPDWRLILCADDDAGTKGNPGLTKATEAARTVGGLLAVPDFGADRPERASDFNDMAAHCGLEAVKIAIDNAQRLTPEPEDADAHEEHEERAAIMTDANAAAAKIPTPETKVVEEAQSGLPPHRNFNLTDAGNGEFIAALFSDRFRHDHARGRDLLFDKHRWRQDATDELILMAKQAARQRYSLGATTSDPDMRKKIAKWAIDSEGKARIDAALAMARCEPPIADSGADWDNRPMLLAVGNGVVDLETGTLRDGKPEDRLILHTSIQFDPEARCPQFERFFGEILNRDADLVDFVFRAIGYSLTGLTTEQVLFILWGSGANGKSVLLSILRAALGDYAHNMPFSTVELKDRASIPNDVAALTDKRLVTAAETNDGARFNEARIKALTGCDPITARFLHHEFFTFRPVAKLWLSVNHKPRVSDDSYGFWRRVRLIPFLRQFRDDADPNLEAKLRDELPGILTFFVRGCREWGNRGLKPPGCVMTATEEYRQESDPLGRFIEERCRIVPTGLVSASEFYKAYQAWTIEQGFTERERLSATGFGRRMSERFEKKGTRKGVFYEGVDLNL